MLMINESQNKVLDCALKTYGAENQIKIAIEELTELSLSLQHGLRRGFNNPKNIQEETADVFIILQYLDRLFSEIPIQEVVDFKIKRLKTTIEKSEHDKLVFSVSEKIVGEYF